MDIQENLKYWGKDYDWKMAGKEWSSRWGSVDMEWYGSILPRIHKFLPAGVILEIAPGFGRWTHYLKKHCQKFIGIDLSPKCVAMCEERFKEDRHMEFYVNDGKSLDSVKDGSIDFIFSFDSLVHAESDVIQSYLSQLARKLKTSGAGVIHHSNIGEYWKMPFIQDFINLHGIRYQDHSRSYSMTALKFRAYAQQAGLKMISQEIINWEKNPQLIDCISIFANRDFPLNATEVIVRNPHFIKDVKALRQLNDLQAHY